jgi:hypothetical protein
MLRRVQLRAVRRVRHRRVVAVVTVGQTDDVAAKVSVLEVCVARLGTHRGALAAANVAQWAIATAELGRVPTTVEYSDYWAINERSGWRHRARVHEGLGDQWPAVVEQLARRLGERRSPRAVMSLPAPALAV